MMFDPPNELRFRVSSASYDSISSLLTSHQYPHTFTLIPEHEHVRAFDGPVLEALARAATDWCEDQFGPRILPAFDCLGDWTCISLTFGFRIPEQATAFKVRWC
jgi:hypothetical protein